MMFFKRKTERRIACGETLLRRGGEQNEKLRSAKTCHLLHQTPLPPLRGTFPSRGEGRKTPAGAMCYRGNTCAKFWSGGSSVGCAVVFVAIKDIDVTP